VTPLAEEILRRSALMRFVPPEHYARLRDRFSEARYDFGETIVRQGEEAEAFFILVTGRARVLKESATGEATPLNRLVPGDEFGESALLAGGPRGATVRASTTVEVLRLERAGFLALVAEFPELRGALELLARWRTLHGFLYEFSNFGRLPGPALQALMAGLQPVRAAQGEVIVREGDPPGPMFIVQSGRVRVFTGPRASAVNRAFYRAGEFFGELSLLNHAPRAATVEAMTDCDLLALAPEAVASLRTKFPEFERLLTERLAQYQHTEAARVPLDFAEELLPAEARVADKTAEAEEPDDEVDEPFAQGGLFRKRPGRSPRFPLIRQIDQMDCGSASLAMVCRHFGREVSRARIRALCHTASDGTSLKGLCGAATELGLAARGLKVSARNLDQMPLPAICHWEGNHWVVLADVSAKHVRVADPGRGWRKLPREDFLAQWSGYAALFDYTTAFDQAPESQPSLAWLRPFLSEHRATLVQALGLAGLASVLGLLFPIFTQLVVDKVIVERAPGVLGLVLLAMTAALGFLLVANLLQQYLLSLTAVRLDTAVLDFLTRR